MSHKMATIFYFAFWSSFMLDLAVVLGNPEQGKRTYQLNQDNQFAAIAKHMFKNSKITVTVSLSCKGPEEFKDLEISWLLRRSPCALEYVSLTEEINTNKDMGGLEQFMNNPVTYLHPPYTSLELLSDNLPHSCSEEHFKLEGNETRKPVIWKVPVFPKNLTEASLASKVTAGASGQGGAPSAGGAGSTAERSGSSAPAASRQKRAASEAGGKGQAASATLSKPNTPQPRLVATTEGFSDTTDLDWDTSTEFDWHIGKIQHQPFTKTWGDGNYLFVIRFRPLHEDAKFTADVTIRTFYGNENYISALDYPLLVFYGVMGLIYIAFGVVWLALLACNWRDLLRVQFWIGGVILLGMLEKAVFFAEYENVNTTGESGSGTLLFAELVSCLKRTLARMLVIIVSLGFGIVKPRLGQAFHKVLFVGSMFFVFSAIEGYMRAMSSKVDQSNQALFAAVPLAVLDSVICWWIFSSLIQTTHTLRLRRNLVKLSLYRHFTNALIFNVLASVAYMVWFFTQHRFKDCVKDWRQLWVDEAFWHVLFVVLLFIIIILWRPSANNQRYAFSPLLDAADEEEEDSMMNDAFDGMKMRGAKNGTAKQRDSKHKMEEDLKWVEENIPSSVADKALPSMLDSDEELMTTKLEMSKMQ